MLKEYKVNNVEIAKNKDTIHLSILIRSLISLKVFGT
jgi:hypothetical protein